MTTVIFYEKPGCINNTKQKQLLSAAGHQVIAKNLLTEVWTVEKLKPFLENYLVSEWFNRSAPQIKNGEIEPEKLNAQQALSLLIAEPLLIRRPLMQTEADYRIGFDTQGVHQWIGLNLQTAEDLETCPRQKIPCPSSTSEVV